MDVAYDHIQEQTFSPDDIPIERDDAAPRKDLNTEVREAYSAISASPWGMKLGGFFSQVKKQGETYYEGARQEISAASSEASKGLSDLTKNLNLRPASSDAPIQNDAAHSSAGTTAALSPTDFAKEAANLFQQFVKKRTTSDLTHPESLDASHSDVLKDTDSFIHRFQTEASARLKKVQAAEDAADEALERFGMNIKNFLRDAVKITPPLLNADGTEKTTILFESKDAEGRRVVHATRFDAQLHVIHTTANSFVQDPDSNEYEPWKGDFSVENKTGDIAKDLDKYEELRRAMEKLVPEKVDYANFWTRYYFLRHVIETEEQRRRELLQKTQAEEEVVRWDDDEDDTEEKPIEAAATVGVVNEIPSISPSEPEVVEDGSKTPTTATVADEAAAADGLLKPAESRKSNEHSVADSDASYDILSGPTSRGPGTPKEEKEAVLKKPKTVTEESDEDDWE